MKVTSSGPGSISPCSRRSAIRRSALRTRSVPLFLHRQAGFLQRTPAAVDCLPGRSCRCTLRVVSPLDNIFEDLKALPPARLEVAADFVHRLKRISDEERQAIFTRTAGALSAEEADELERVIEEGCEKIDEHGW